MRSSPLLASFRDAVGFTPDKPPNQQPHIHSVSDFFKTFKSVFIVDEPQKQGQPAAQATQQPEQQVIAQQEPTRAPIPSSKGAVTDKFMEILSSALERNNQPGFDYFEFSQALKNLEKMPMDEVTRFQSAYAMAQAMGATPQKLAESAQYYLQVLGAEQSKFNEAHAQQRSRMIGGREEEIKNLEATIQQKTEQIKQLTLQIEEHRQRSDQMRQEISDSTIKIENTKADFEATFTSVAGKIQEDLAKIQQHLR